MALLIPLSHPQTQLCPLAGAGWVVVSQWAALLGKAPPPRLPSKSSLPPTSTSILSLQTWQSVCAVSASPTAPVIAFRWAVELGVCASI